MINDGTWHTFFGIWVSSKNCNENVFCFIKKVNGGCYSNYFLYKKLMETPDFQTIQNGKT